MAVSLFAPGFLFLLAAVVLLVVVSVSAPVWNNVYFLKLSAAGQTVRAGVWGYCQGSTCTKARLGYTLPEQLLGGSSRADNLLGASTKGLILHPIAAGLAAFALVFALCGNIITGVMASIASFIAFLVALIALIIDLVIFITAHRKARDNNVSASYGNALWMTVAAVALLLLASFTVCCAHHRSRRSRNVDRSAPVMTEGGRRPFWKRNRGVATV